MTEHIDMSQFIAARSDQLNADDLLDAPRTITITKVTASPDAAEQPVSVHYEGDGGKPFKPCKTVRRIMVGVWGKHASEYVGRSMTLYRDSTVSFGGMQVGGIRVSHMSHIDDKKTVALQVTRGRKAPYTVHPLRDAPAASDTGLAAARKALTNAATLDALRTAWTSKAMAPYRDQLQGLLDERKATLSFDSTPQPAAGGGSPADADPFDTAPEAAAGGDGGEKPTLDEAKASCDRAESADRLTEKVDGYRGELSDEDQTALGTYAAGIAEQRGWNQ